MNLKVDPNIKNYGLRTRAHMITVDNKKGNLDICLVSFYDEDTSDILVLAQSNYVFEHEWKSTVAPGNIIRFRDGSLHRVTEVIPYYSRSGIRIEPITREELTPEQNKALFTLELDYVPFWQDNSYNYNIFGGSNYEY